MDHVLCASPDLIRKNESLALAWDKLRQKMDETARKDLVQSQHVWLKTLGTACGLPDHGKSSGEVIEQSSPCVGAWIDLREADLRSMTSQADQPSRTMALTDQPVPISVAYGPFNSTGMLGTLLIGTGPERFTILTGLPPQNLELMEFPGPEAVPRVARGLIHWQPPYLMVEAEWNWRQPIYNAVQVFKWSDGRLRRLGALGGGGWSGKMDQGRFLSQYNKEPVWDSTGFFCTACKSNLQIALRDIGETLTADSASTWEVNRTIWQQNEATLQNGFPVPAVPPDDDTMFRWRMSVTRSLIENAVLAKYCGKEAELDRLTALAEKLPAEDHADFDKALAHVVPLEAPDRWGARYIG